MAANTAFFPALMWNERFFSASGDPFDNSQGFVFPLPEGATKFPPRDPCHQDTCWPPRVTCRPLNWLKSPGFTGTAGTIGH